jgi:uncharacterized protein (DUF1800 family)
MTTREAFIAVTRFGLGAKPGELRAAAADPRAWLLAQLRGPQPTPPLLTGFRSGDEAMAQFQRSRQERGDAGAIRLFQEEFREAYASEAAARALTQVQSDQPFRERLVAFWSNHFTVSVQRPIILGLAGAFEREAIRPHVTGKFRDLLLASTRHQAMLSYLDNAVSVGPNSVAGRRRNAGLNENLAREILELHTLGVEGGYTQNDVREFARILTGWTVGRVGESNAGQFMFLRRIHDPGPKTLLGVTYEEGGETEGLSALTALARHPATAKHVATKFARHFVADKPAPALVARLSTLFLDSDGDLGALARAVVEGPEAWADVQPKVKNTNDYVVSTLRATGFAGEAKNIVQSLRLLGQPPLAAPSPAGWPDTADQWIGPESVLRRAEWTMSVAHKASAAHQPLDMFEDTIAPVATRETRLAVERAPSAADAIALILASPEFQRR